METFHKGADLKCGSASVVFLWLPSWEDWGGTRDATRLDLEEPQQRPRAVGQRWSSIAKRIFPAAFQKKNQKNNPTQINAERKNKPFPKALEEGFPASLALSFPFEGCSISSDVL